MPKFPKKEADIYALVTQMIAGYTAYPAVFPHANVAALEDALNDAHNQVIVQNCFLADARIATEAKEVAFDDLVAEMKRQLKRSTVDTKDNPTALTLIGWDAKPESKVSGAGESHPRALREPDMHVSAHPAPITQPMAKAPIANVRTTVGHAVQYGVASGSLGVDA